MTPRIPVRQSTIRAVFDALTKASRLVRSIADDERFERRMGPAREVENIIVKAARLLSEDQRK